MDGWMDWHGLFSWYSGGRKERRGKTVKVKVKVKVRRAIGVGSLSGVGGHVAGEAEAGREGGGIWG